jgi:GT2 family glycosyltransferase
LRALGSRFAVDPELDALGGLILPAVLETPAQLWFEEYFGGFSRSYLPARASSDNHEDDEVFPFAPGRYAAGANMAFRREALERIGGFERELGTGTLTKGGEDIAAVLELAGLGSVVGYEPRAVVRHRHRVTPEDFRQQVFGYGVGLTAMYTSFALRHPRQIRAMFGLLRVGFSSLSSSRALRSPDDSPSYPKSTKAVELVGMLYGPVAYFRSWFHFRRL